MLTALATSFYARIPCINFGEVFCFLPEICIALEAVFLKLHAKLTPGWALIRVNFDLIQEIGPKVGGGRSFVSGTFFPETTVNIVFKFRYTDTENLSL